ncbi:MAG: hypothetical protein JWL74_568 [Alphaproteobacteria bacterium]|jgi:LPXTG-motif cell wall-anchored protein|nr:hypothetical protein [Alphaproteobacteria bacterium]
MTGPSALIMSLLMLVGFALAAGGAYLIGRRKDRRRGLLMLVAALVMWGNVAILTL